MIIIRTNGEDIGERLRFTQKRRSTKKNNGDE